MAIFLLPNLSGSVLPNMSTWRKHRPTLAPPSLLLTRSDERGMCELVNWQAWNEEAGEVRGGGTELLPLGETGR